MKIDLRTIACFGVAGNFTGHLEQAGEAADFAAVVTAAPKAPKAVFPTYIPGAPAPVPTFLGVYPFDEYRIIFPPHETKLQLEPECALLCAVRWDGDRVAAVLPESFGASNDCSIRKAGARKISEKKNWGPASKGLAGNLLPIDRFAPGGILDRYRIASFMVRQGQVFPYGEDSAVRHYNYLYAKLTAWLVDRFNHQGDEGPAEPIGAYLRACGRPARVMISVGATRYTQFGETHFLAAGDRAVVVLYPEDVYSAEDISRRAARDNLEEDDISVLNQEVVI